ncbi:MAG: hypothetical protein IT548_06230 [Alphaproteobacteria bacterium]|nr:hypothetical protein [Alphaproteobacteria bacterium]
MTSAALSKSKARRREEPPDARQRQLQALAKRPVRAAGRRSARWEILGVFVLGLGLVAFPWGRVNAALNGTQKHPELTAAAPEAIAEDTETLTDRSCAEDAVVAVSTSTSPRTAPADPCSPGR